MVYFITLQATLANLEGSKLKVALLTMFSPGLVKYFIHRRKHGQGDESDVIIDLI